MAVVSYPFTTQQCAHVGPLPAAADRPRHYVADGASTIANVDGAAAEGSTAAVNGTFYVMDGGVWTQLGAGGATPDADASTKGKLKLRQDLGGTADAPLVVGLTETGNPTSLPIGAWADGQVLTRVGANAVGVTPDMTARVYRAMNFF